MIRLENVEKAFGERQILRGVTFSVAAGNTFVIMGPSGCGKSTILRHVIGLLQPDAGKVEVAGQSVPDLDRRGLLALRSRIGYLFQSGALINWLTVFENVALPLREAARLGRSEIEQRVRENLGAVKMDHAADLLPDQISGGMKKRAALARALVTHPQVLLYDEPTSGLDPIMADDVSRLIRTVQERYRVTSVVVTHNRGSALFIGDVIGVMDKGRLVEQGKPDELKNSTNEKVREFLKAVDE